MSGPLRPPTGIEMPVLLTVPDHVPAPVAVIAHRGASGYRPEHTIASYELAIEQGADIIEPDLVSTADGVLVARHENEIGGTTDVAAHPEFAARHTTKTIDGRSVTGWFTEDFTLAELRTLRAVERLPQMRPGNTVYDGRFAIPTFDEVLDLAVAAGRRTGRTIGVAPETKHPSHFAALGLSLTEPLLASLRRVGWDHAGAPVIVQSFETGNLRDLAGRSGVPLAQLVDSHGAPFDRQLAGDPTTYADLLTPVGLREVSTYAGWLAPHKHLVLPRDADGALTGEHRLVDEAHEVGLRVVAWTFRLENHFLPADLRRRGGPNAPGSLTRELRAALRAGVDAVFTDHPDLAVSVRDAHASGTASGALMHRA